ncbi:2,3-bisphosphoglycerate-independent phosphoglycerate mutase [Dehalococcoidia bacterium]|nr:2,3-bisphosphoglycerate-independent phosphoglycerate mutase [Dehalococcoidia bacterium]
MTFEHMADISLETPSKILLLVIDGLGGLRDPKTGKSEMETANIPNLDALAAESALGLTDPVMAGITPGSGPGHLALFGYDPVGYLIKRGVMEALGSGLDLQPGEIAARGNFCTMDEQGLVVDRRAGRIPSEQSAPLCELLNAIELADADVSVHQVKDHRYAAIFRGQGLTDNVSDTDSGRADMAPQEVHALAPGAEKMARAANEFTTKARTILANQPVANMALLRGFSGLPNVPSMTDLFKLNPVAIASYPMYRGLAQIVGMDVLPTGTTLGDELDTVESCYDKYDFFFVHVKAADAAGEDGNFAAKVKAIEDVDPYIPRLRSINPDVLMVAGDHSTPSLLAAHSWHPVPFLLNSPYSGADGLAEFSEQSCARGSLGRFPAQQALVLAMANALKLTKFGA